MRSLTKKIKLTSFEGVSLHNIAARYRLRASKGGLAGKKKLLPWADNGLLCKGHSPVAVRLVWRLPRKNPYKDIMA